MNIESASTVHSLILIHDVMQFVYSRLLSLRFPLHFEGRMKSIYLSFYHLFHTLFLRLLLTLLLKLFLTLFPVSDSQKAAIEQHRPSLVKKILFHDFVDVRGKNRIVRFIIFRNMLLQKIRDVTEELGLPGFDYVMMIDLDIREFDVKSLFRDLNDSPYDILCANGLFKLEIMRDTFASVMTNGTWLYTYHSLYDHHFKDLLYWPSDRYQAMNSCFGGLAVYKDSRKLLGSGCEYTILEDLKSEWEYAQVYKNQTGKDRAWPVENSWFLDAQYREPLIELVTMFYNANLRVGKERRKICEHLAYHYCLRAHDYTLAISRDLIVYYFDFARMASNPI